MATPVNLSVVKAFGIVMLLQSHHKGLSLGQIARELKMATPTAHRFLRTLLAVGAVDLTNSGAYRIGSLFSEIQSSAHLRPELQSLLDNHAKQLSAICRETVHVGVRTGDMVRYVSKAESPRSLQTVMKVGTELEAYCTALGKILLSHLPDKARYKFACSGNLVKLTPNTIASRDRLLVEFEAIRRRGFAFDDEEFEPGLRCVAVPIEIDGMVVASMSISGPAARLSPDALPRIADTLRQRSSLIVSDIERRPVFKRILSVF